MPLRSNIVGSVLQNCISPVLACLLFERLLFHLLGMDIRNLPVVGQVEKYKILDCVGVIAGNRMLDGLSPVSV